MRADFTLGAAGAASVKAISRSAAAMSGAVPSKSDAAASGSIPTIGMPETKSVAGEPAAVISKGLDKQRLPVCFRKDQ
jgi:hypothetical protein